MKNLKERYIYDVVRRIPENQRDEVAKELDANISDMMHGSSDSELERVIYELGEPRVLASEYTDKKRYLIGPKWMEDYLRTLKIVIAVFVSLSLVFGLLDNVLHPEATSAIGIFAEVFAKTISEMWNSALSAFAFVTLVFALIERYDLSPKKKPWRIDSLPELPKKDVLKSSRTGNIVGLAFLLIFGIAWGYILYFNETYLRLVFIDGDIHFSEALFNPSAIEAYFPLFLIGLTLSIAVLVYKIYQGYINLNIVLLATVEKIFSLLAFLYILHYTPLFSSSFISEISGYSGIAISQINDGISQGVTVITSIIPIFVAIDIITLWVKYLKHQKELKKTK